VAWLARRGINIQSRRCLSLMTGLNLNMLNGGKCEKWKREGGRGSTESYGSPSVECTPIFTYLRLHLMQLIPCKPFRQLIARHFTPPPSHPDPRHPHVFGSAHLKTIRTPGELIPLSDLHIFA
jgi:hypothetical protein